ncbi:MAG: translocation/assembly module TamB [Nitrospirae bacterium]|nr:translocation/assembly module TamB [Nitrospirota bacterium]
MGKITIKKILVLAAVVTAVVSVFIFFRGPHVSNMLKKLILPELSVATGKEIMAEKIYVNIFPLFIEAKEIKVFDKGAEIAHIPRVKGYVELSGLLRKELVLRRLVVREPHISADAFQMEEIAANVKKYLDMERKAPIKVVVRAIALDNGAFAFGYKGMSFQGRGFGVEAVLNPKEIVVRKRPVPRINFIMKELSASIKGWPELKGEIKGALAIRSDAVEVKGLQIGFSGSKITASGLFPTREKAQAKTSRGLYGDLQLGFSLLVDSFKKIFSLKQRGEGEISAKGTIHLLTDDPLRSAVDVKLKGDFYIETLMELLEVKERVEGLVDFTGSIKGPLSGITGAAKARLQKGNLFDIAVDDLRCNVDYREGRLYFTEGKGVLYNGRADAEATLSVTREEYYSLKVAFSDVDSPAAFKLIGWDPGISRGKVRGELSTEGARFDPSGWYSYESAGRGADILGRIRKVKGSFGVRNDVITLSESVASTDKSVMNFGGTVDLKASDLSLTLQGKTADLTDVTLPYLHELTGSGEFSGTLTGKFDNPVITGKVKLHSASYGEYVLGDVMSDLRYRKDLLELKELFAVAGSQAGNGMQSDHRATIVMKGSVKFPEGKELFDLKKPLYGLSVSMKNADLERALKVIYKKPLKPQPGGKFDTVLSITGHGPQPLFKGTARMENGALGRIPLDSAALSYSYDYDTLIVEDVLLKKGDSLLTGKGSVTHDDRFSFSASGSRLFLKDIPLRGSPSDAYVSVKAEGKGTLDDPRMELDATVHGGKFRDSSLGDGKIRASVKDRVLLLDAALLDGRTTLSGKANLGGDIPWTARLDMKSGRYDFLVAAFLREIPEDLLINMKGYAEMTGDRNHFSAEAAINQLNVTLYGYSFSNDSDIRFEVKDRKIALSTVKMRSGTTSFKVEGDVEVGRGYNLVMEGSTALSPLKGLWKRIDIVRGEAGLVFSLTGKWDNPKLNGGVTVSNAVFGVKDIPYRISAINGYVYMDEDRIVIQKLSGKAGGGDVNISGVAYLQRFKMKRFYLDSSLTGVGGNVSREFPVNFDGNILYSGTLDAQTISGDVKINRAKYRERVEWKSLMLKAKPKEKPRGELGALEKAALNVRVHGSENIVVDNNIARAALKVDLVLRGTVSHPVLLGRVESKTGTVYFRNNEFRLINASADFSDPRRINPVLQVVAETNVKGYNIRLNLEGQKEHFNLALVSDPPLDEMDILSLLTVGRFGKELKGIEGGIGAGAATSFLAGRVQDVLEERLRTIAGLDRLEVDSYVSKSTGTITPRVTASKRLLGDRLFVTYSSAVGTAESNVLKLEYLLSRNVSLIGVRDEVGSIGGDIKFRFEFK